MAAREADSIPRAEPERLQRATELAERAPLPARVGNVQFGTAGWTDRTLIASGTFYPKPAKTPEARLRHYAAHFSFVEVDATYYTLLPPDLPERWLSWTPPDFRFDVKAFPVFTGHPIDILRLPPDLRLACQAEGHERRVYPEKLAPEIAEEIRTRFVAMLEPLLRAGRLGAVLVQFPPWFVATRGNARRVEELRERHPELPFAIEFRHASWFLPERTQRVSALLRGAAMSYVCVDEPGISFEPLVTSETLSIVRFHGQNVEGFRKRGATVAEKFNYLYDPAELRAFVAPVRTLSGLAREVHAVFNNCMRNYAILGAKDLSVLLTDGNEASPDGLRSEA